VKNALRFLVSWVFFVVLYFGQLPLALKINPFVFNIPWSWQNFFVSGHGLVLLYLHSPTEWTIWGVFLTALLAGWTAYIIHLQFD